MNIGKFLIIIGSVILVVGIVIHTIPDKLKWFGRLPLDYRYESDSTSIFIPFGSMILISVFLSLFLNIFFRWFK
jgi:hypothetical protein